MIEPVEWLRTFILLHLSLEYLIIFFAAAFGAEPALLTLGFLAAQGVFPIYPVMLLSFLGTFLSDGFWFLLGRTATMRKIISSRLADKTISVISRAIKRISRGNNVIILIIIKFVVGTRVLVIMSLSSTDMKLREFMRSNVAAGLGSYPHRISVRAWFYLYGRHSGKHIRRHRVYPACGNTSGNLGDMDKEGFYPCARLKKV